MKYIAITQGYGGDIHINTEHIVSIQRYDDGTYISLTTKASIITTDSVNMIMEKLGELR